MSLLGEGCPVRGTDQALALDQSLALGLGLVYTHIASTCIHLYNIHLYPFIVSFYSMKTF